MTGDPSDISLRLRLALPLRWFGDVAPILDGVLAGLSVAWAGFYSLLQLVRVQSRVRTATDEFLDLAAQDFLGNSWARRPQESDKQFRQRLLWAMGRERTTRASVVDAAAQAGFSVTIFEPAQPHDTGAYNVPLRLAWNFAGGWGSLEMPFESLITARAGTQSFSEELWQGVAEAVPAGGVGWVRVAS